MFLFWRPSPKHNSQDLWSTKNHIQSEKYRQCQSNCLSLKVCLWMSLILKTFKGDIAASVHGMALWEQSYLVVALTRKHTHAHCWKAWKGSIRAAEKSKRVWLQTQQKVSKQSDHPQHGAHWDVVSLNSGGAFRRPVLIYPSALDFTGICSLVGDPGLRCAADTGLIELWWVRRRAECALMVLCRPCPASVLLMHSALSKVTETSHC